MNTERIIVLENVSDKLIGLKDTQGRIYALGRKGKQRIAEVSLQDILDYNPSKKILTAGDVKVSNISSTKLYEMGLTEEEIKIIAPTATKATKENKEVVEEAAPTVVKSTATKSTVKKTTKNN